MSLKIFCLNCQKAYQKDFKDYIISTIQSKKYDFFLLQEANQKVREIIEPHLEEFHYKKVNVISPKTGNFLNIMLLYKSKFKFLRSDFITFTPLVFQEVTETGSILALFKLPTIMSQSLKRKFVLVGVTHIHASYRVIARRKELLHVKKQLLSSGDEDQCIKLVGGDFNNLINGEGDLNDKMMFPEFINATDFEDHTCDTALIEDIYSRGWLTRIFFARGKSYKKKIDHIYLDTKSMEKYSISSGIIDVKASDHRPIYLEIRKKRRNETSYFKLSKRK